MKSSQLLLTIRIGTRRTLIGIREGDTPEALAGRAVAYFMADDAYRRRVVRPDADSPILPGVRYGISTESIAGHEHLAGMDAIRSAAREGDEVWLIEDRPA